MHVEVGGDVAVDLVVQGRWPSTHSYLLPELVDMGTMGLAPTQGERAMDDEDAVEREPTGPHEPRGRRGGARYFVKVRVPSRQDIRKLAQFDLDLHAVHDEGDGASVDGLMTLDEASKLVKAGFPVLIESEADQQAHARNVIEFEEWLDAQTDDLGQLGEG